MTGTMSVSPIIELGEEIEKAWQARDYDLGAFPLLCAERLKAARVHAKVAPDDVLRWTLAGEVPRQFDPKAKFGQPPITVFRARRFVIDVLFWVDGTTAIHDHGFSGAFQVLAGSSIETNFEFSISRDVDGRLQFGSLSVLRTALRRSGDAVPIVAGPGYIHSLFHLDRPSVSLVVRTFWNARPGIQLRYEPAGFAWDDFVEDEIRDRQLQIVELLRQTDDPSFEAYVGDLIEKADLQTALAIIRACSRVRDTRVQDRLVQRARSPALVSAFTDWLAQERRLKLLRRARTDVSDPALRFLLAVLLNTHRRVDALALVTEYAPDVDPARQIARWLKQLSTMSIRLQIGSAPWEPNILGLPAFEEGSEEVLASALAGRDEPRGESERHFLGRLAALPPLLPLFS
jgi:hypothetical protein